MTDNDDNNERIPDGDGNRRKGVEVGVTAGEILREGGFVLPPTPASPSRTDREGRGEKRSRNERKAEDGKETNKRFHS